MATVPAEDRRAPGQSRLSLPVSNATTDRLRRRSLENVGDLLADLEASKRKGSRDTIDRFSDGAGAFGLDDEDNDEDQNGLSLCFF